MQQYAVLIPGLIIIWVLIIAIRVGAYMDAKARLENPKPIVIPEKACPPHSWRWEEQPGMEGVSYMWCLRCGKTPRQVSEGP